MEVESTKYNGKFLGANPAAASSSSPSTLEKKMKQRTRRNICLALVAFVLGIIILMIILGFTVFKAKRPVTTINSLALHDFQVSLDILRLRVSLNLTLDVNLSVQNPNKVGFEYTNTSAVLRYRGRVVGEAPIPAGKISAGETMPLNLMLTLMADRFVSDSNLYSDVIAGTLPLNTYTRISGKVRVLNIFKIHVVSSSSCDFNIDVADRSIANQSCHYKTQL